MDDRGSSGALCNDVQVEFAAKIISVTTPGSLPGHLPGPIPGPIPGLLPGLIPGPIPDPMPAGKGGIMAKKIVWKSVKIMIFLGKWSQNGVWALSGAKMGPGWPKRRPGSKV